MTSYYNRVSGLATYLLLLVVRRCFEIIMCNEEHVKTGIQAIIILLRYRLYYQMNFGSIAGLMESRYALC